MTPELKEQLKKRFKSFLWRVGSYAAVALLALLVDVLGILQIPAPIVAVVALACGEITKFLNTYTPVEPSLP